MVANVGYEEVVQNMSNLNPKLRVDIKEKYKKYKIHYDTWT